MPLLPAVLLVLAAGVSGGLVAASGAVVSNRDDLGAAVAKYHHGAHFGGELNEELLLISVLVRGLQWRPMPSFLESHAFKANRWAVLWKRIPRV